jgi:hypothetical protein
MNAFDGTSGTVEVGDQVQDHACHRRATAGASPGASRYGFTCLSILSGDFR